MARATICLAFTCRTSMRQFQTSCVSAARCDSIALLTSRTRQTVRSLAANRSGRTIVCKLMIFLAALVSSRRRQNMQASLSTTAAAFARRTHRQRPPGLCAGPRPFAQRPARGLAGRRADHRRHHQRLRAGLAGGRRGRGLCVDARPRAATLNEVFDTDYGYDLL